GILTLTSYAHRTSPVLRGKWLLENILGAPPPPPPPNVPALKENSESAEKLSVRDRMERHRANPVCASCHKLMTYALGRGVEYNDMPAVRQVLRDAAPGGYTWSSIIVGIVKSQPFQMRLAEEQKTVALTGAQPRARLGDPAMPQALQQEDTVTARAGSVR